MKDKWKICHAVCLHLNITSNAFILGRQRIEVRLSVTAYDNIQIAIKMTKNRNYIMACCGAEQSQTTKLVFCASWPPGDLDLTFNGLLFD